MEEFDYIIIGAGSAGCVLTNRIINSGKFKVLLIEAVEMIVIHGYIFLLVIIKLCTIQKLIGAIKQNQMKVWRMFQYRIQEEKHWG